MAVEITNQNLFGKAAADALVAINYNSELNTFEKIRWVNAIAKAMIKVETEAASMTWMSEGEYLLIWSQGSGGIYEANGTCSCEAFKHGRPCWHRSLARLVKRYLELVKAEDDAALEKAARLSEFARRLREMPRVADAKAKHIRDEDAPYLKPTNHAPAIRIGGIRIN